MAIFEGVTVLLDIILLFSLLYIIERDDIWTIQFYEMRILWGKNRQANYTVRNAFFTCK